MTEFSNEVFLKVLDIMLIILYYPMVVTQVKKSGFLNYIWE